MSWPQALMIIILTLGFCGPIARCFGAEFDIPKQKPINRLISEGIYVSSIAMLLFYGGFWS